VAFGQDTLAVSSGTAVQGGSIALNLSLSSPAGSAPAGVQWTLTYAAADVASIGAVAGSSATAAGKTIACFSGVGSYTCLLSGMNDAVMQNGVVAAINVTMTSSAVTTPVSLANLTGAAAAGSAISMTGTGGTITLPAPPVSSPALSALSCSPTSFISGGTSTCTVTLSQVAGSGGVAVTLSSNATALTVPASVNVASGASSVSFTATAGTVSANQAAVVTASLNGSSQRAFVTLVFTTPESVSVSLLSCSPDPNVAGGLDCTVSLAQAAPPGGMTVTLLSNTSRVQVPAQVSIPAGAQSVPFVATVISSDQDAQVQIAASAQGASTTASIPITGIRPTSLSCAPQTVPAGGFSTCTVGMNNPNVLQVARLVVSSDSASLELPGPFTTRPGQAQLSFEVFTTPLAAQQSSTVTVQFGQTSVTSSVAVTPATAPILNLPGTELAAFGKPMAFTISAMDPGGLPLTLSAANLPAGASFDPATGDFLWTPQSPSGIVSYHPARSSPLGRRSVPSPQPIPRSYPRPAPWWSKPIRASR